MKFWALTVSLIPLDQNLFYEEGREKDISLIPDGLVFLGNDINTRSLKILKLRNIKRYDNNLIGLYTRREVAHLYDENFQPNNQNNFPPKIWIWDHAEQTLLVQVNKRIFVDAEAAGRAFEKILDKFLMRHNLEARIYPKIEEGWFWSAVKEFSSINELTFEYATPNMFGNTKAEMTAFLHEIRNETNATVVVTKLVNKDGNIHPKSEGMIKRAIDWIKDGGGRWAIKGRLNPEARLSTITSGKQASIFVLPDKLIGIDTSGYSSNELTKIIKALQPEYTYKKDNKLT